MCVHARTRVRTHFFTARSVDTDLSEVAALAQVRADVRVSRDEVFARIMDEMFRQLYLRVCDELTIERRTGAGGGGMHAHGDTHMHHCAQVCGARIVQARTHRRVIPTNRQLPLMRLALRMRLKLHLCQHRRSNRVFSIWPSYATRSV